MVNPQTEDGHVDIANEIVEALARFRLSGEENQVLWALLRKTYGWHKKEDKISLSQFANMTGLKRQNVQRALKKLSSKMITVIKNDDSQVRTYGFNKHYDQWKPSSKLITVINLDKAPSSKLMHTKETTTKEKRIKTSFVETSNEVRLARLLFQKIKDRKPDIKEPNMQTWAKEIDLMMRIDRRTPEGIQKVIEWCQGDSFWQNNILSAAKLRKQFDQLELKMIAPKKESQFL